jgi:uncharacterized damage-inducible protein DinB
MRIDDIKLLYEYNDWATARILRAAEGVSQEQFLEQNEFGWGNLRGTLVHILQAEIVWRHRLFEHGEIDWLDAADFPDVASIRGRREREMGAFWSWLNAQSDADVNRIHSTERKGEARSAALWQFLVHLVNHGTQHRSECAALLTGFGHSPGDLDLVLFIGSR